ncbi:MAG: asparagine synthase-related protein [bacterium]|nr:asparagine synthase-related protein [bacterium]
MNYAIGGLNMSAIWGLIQHTECLKEHSSIFKAVYQKKCILDRLNEKTTECQVFGCGIQFITEESKNEQLPIYSEENQILFTADCLLDNRSELIDALNIEDQTIPDGTLLYLAYLHWGYDCVKHLHGLYSIAVYEKATHTLFLATDPTASRCLYYYNHKDGCTFSTLIEPILQIHTGIQKNELYLGDYLMAQGLRPNISAIETPYEDIYKLEAGTYVLITNGNKQIHRYWSPQKLPLKLKTEAQCKKHFISIFKKCVHNALRTNGEVGIALSSGFDSSSVAAIAAQDLQQASRNLYSYTYVPYYDKISDKQASYFVLNEKEAVEKTVAMYPNIQPSFLNTDGIDFYQSMDKILSIMEIPFKAFINLPSLLELFKTASLDKCKVFLTGQYGNATISYGDIDNILYDMYSNKHYLSYLSTLNHYCKNAKESRRQSFRGCQRYFHSTDKALKSTCTITRNTPDNQFLDQDFISKYPYESRYANEKLPTTANTALPKDLYEYYLYYPSALTYLGEYETKFGLANGIIIRDPTRDPDIISFCHSIPYKFFAYKGIPRWLVREGLKDYLPKEIIGPYLRYGLQNADWAYRVNLNWNNIYPVLKHNLAAPSLEKYINSSKINSFFIKNENTFDETVYEQSIYLFIFDILSRFLA